MRKKTERLLLRPLEAKDQQEVLDLLTDFAVKQTYMLPDYDKREDAIPLFKRLVRLSHDDRRVVVGIDLEGHVIGFMNDVEMDSNAIEMGYVVHPRHQGKGYCTEAFRAMIDLLFERGFNEVTTGAFEENAASIRVMQKCGMQKLDKTDEIEYRGRKHLCVYYCIRK